MEADQDADDNGADAEEKYIKAARSRKLREEKEKTQEDPQPPVHNVFSPLRPLNLAEVPWYFNLHDSYALGLS